MKPLPSEKELNALRDQCYQIACEHGFHEVRYSPQHFLCLVISELMEAVEADRKGRHTDFEKYKQLNEVFTFVGAFEHGIKDTVEDELADAAIRILDLEGVLGENIGFSHVQLFVTPMDSSQPVSSVRGIPQARILEWVSMSSFRRSPRSRD